MQDAIELRDSKQAQHYLLQSWSLGRAAKLNSTTLQATLRVALELASEGNPLAPLGFISDLVSALAGIHQTTAEETWQTPAADSASVRRYEDYVLGKFAADMSLERASDELQKYKGRDRDRAVAFAVQQAQERAGLPCVLIGPAVIKTILAQSGPALQKMFYEALSDDSAQQLRQQWDELIQSVRNSGELLGGEDIFELASGTALSQFGQRLALRQVLQASQHLVVGLPKQKPTGRPRKYEVATNILEEDLYPVGGFASIANRGTMESLLRSELAYMEDGDRPDLFDIKYARDELLYYSRDENQFFRRRVTVLFVLDASLSMTRVKDSSANWQRIVLTLAAIFTLVQTLTEWLASDALQFEVAFLSDLPKGELRSEREVIEMLFREETKAGRLTMSEVNPARLRSRCDELARLSLCHCVLIHAQQANKLDDWLEVNEGPDTSSVWKPLLTKFDVSEALPKVAYDEQTYTFEESAEPWREAVRTLLAAIGV